MTPESRLPHWTDLVLGDRDPPLEISTYGTFSPAQKRWMEQAWRDYCRGNIPDVFAVHLHKCGIPVTDWTIPDRQFEWHHIIPGQDCLANGENPDLPENAIPLPKKQHTGVDDSPIHQDVSDAKALWRYKTAGLIPDPFSDIHRNHAESAAHGRKYWDDSYDQFFLELAQTVVSAFRKNHPEIPWPIKKHKQKTVSSP